MLGLGYIIKLRCISYEIYDVENLIQTNLSRQDLPFKLRDFSTIWAIIS